MGSDRIKRIKKSGAASSVIGEANNGVAAMEDLGEKAGYFDLISVCPD